MPVKAAKPSSPNSSSASVARQEGIDITGGSSKKTTGKALEVVIKLAEELRGIDSRMSVIAEEVTNLNARKQELQNQLLPDRMVEAGVTTFTLSSGDSIEIFNIIQGSIPSETAIEKEKDSMVRAELIGRRKAAFAWLKSVKADSLIKTEVAAFFDKGQNKLARECLKTLTKAGAAALMTEAVHPGTLNKFLRETIEAGKEVPAETFALFTGKQAKLEKPKAKK